MKFIFIADYFLNQVMGGAEYCNNVVIEELKKLGHDVVICNSHEVSTSLLTNLKDHKLIISNFINLKSDVKDWIKDNADYIIYEHDHKYLKTRNPTPFEDYKAPKYQIINEDFYNNAKVVIAQSNMHKEIIQKNLSYARIVAAGVSLWTDEDLDYLEFLNDRCSYKKEKLPYMIQFRPYMDGMFILDSDIQHKGTIEAELYCQKNHLKYSKHKGPWRDLMQFLEGSDGLAFFPHTFETMSRIVVEARMLNIPIKCSKNIGAIYEPWFKEKKGINLIEFHRNEKPKLIQKFVHFFEESMEKEVDNGDITAILTLYRRPQNLVEQIRAIKNQTVPPKEIWVWCNFYDDSFEKMKEVEDALEMADSMGCITLNCNYNFKFYGRYAAALLADTKYVAIFDDDTIPGRKWFENCLNTMKNNRGIVGSAGVILQNKSSYNPHIRAGWPKPNPQVQKVDLVGHASLFERSWLSYLWMEKPPTWDNAEDIQFSYCAQKYGNIETYVAPHPPDDKEMWGSIKGNELGIDDVATSNNKVVSHQQFFSERDMCVQKSVEKGWELVNEGGSYV